MSQCATCGKHLTVEVDPEEEDDEIDQAGASSENMVPDSVELQCGCYFHWCVIHKSLLLALCKEVGDCFSADSR